MTDIPIPADVMKAARKVQRAIGADRPMLKLCMAKAPTCGCGSLCVARTEVIARALMADRAAQVKRMARLEEALRRLLKCEYDGQGLTDCIDNHGCHYPSQELADAIANAEAVVSARALSQEGSDA